MAIRTVTYALTDSGRALDDALRIPERALALHGALGVASAEAAQSA